MYCACTYTHSVVGSTCQSLLVGLAATGHQLLSYSATQLHDLEIEVGLALALDIDLDLDLRESAARTVGAPFWPAASGSVIHDRRIYRPSSATHTPLLRYSAT